MNLATASASPMRCSLFGRANFNVIEMIQQGAGRHVSHFNDGMTAQGWLVP